MTDPEVRQHRLRQAFLTGLVALLPLVLTGFVIHLVWGWFPGIGEVVGRLALQLPEEKPLPLWYQVCATIATLFVVAVAIYILGRFLRTFIGRRLLRLWDGILNRIPLINAIYPHAKQISDFLFGERQTKFSRVVAIEYPRLGVYSLGFATSAGPPSVARHTGREMVAVFVPTSPTPVTGWTVMVNANEVIDLNMDVDEAIRFTVSCGVLVPGQDPFHGIPPPAKHANGEAPPEQSAAQDGEPETTAD